jgi:hypothetical protein
LDIKIKAVAHEIGTAFQSAAQSGLSCYRPIANQILSGQLTSLNEIERILDNMLDYCYDAEILSLYKRVCRYLIHKQPELVYNAVMNYKDMWDCDGGDGE